MWEFFRECLQLFVRSNSKRRILLIFFTGLLLFLGVCIVGIGWIFRSNLNSMELTKRVDSTIHPPTYKEEDLKEISKMLGEIGQNIQMLKNGVDTKVASDNVLLECGINNGELGDWEISVSGKNTLNLEEGNEVLLVNASSPHVPSAKFLVKFVRQQTTSSLGESDKTTELYINKNAARFLSIENAEERGVFELKVQKVR